MQHRSLAAQISHGDHAVTPTVLVPVDGSEKDRRVIPAAAALADLADGDLHVIRVLDIARETLTPRARTMGAADAAAETWREMHQSVRLVADRLVADTGRSVRADVAEGPDVADVLMGSAATRDADLVVMATRAAGPIGRVVRGSVADRVMRESPRPVVLVPPRAGDADGEPLRLGRVLVPLDGSERSSAVLDQLLRLKRARELELVLLEVVTSGALLQWVPDPLELRPHGLSPDFPESRASAEERLNREADRLRAQGATNVGVRVVEDINPAAAITRVAREEHADLIAMSTRGAGGLERFVVGSVAEAVVRHSEVPVLLVKPREAP
jgi:nucleotide-binding universal stress UspA family protein